MLYLFIITNYIQNQLTIVSNGRCSNCNPSAPTSSSSSSSSSSSVITIIIG